MGSEEALGQPGSASGLVGRTPLKPNGPGRDGSRRFDLKVDKIKKLGMDTSSLNSRSEEN